MPLSLHPLEQLPVAALRIEGAMLSDPGLLREVNEDRCAYQLQRAGADRAIFVVADGMGGHVAGEQASEIACAAVMRHFLDETHPLEMLATAFRDANQGVWGRAQAEPALAGMGTTLTAVVVDRGQGYFAHVGDSRLYGMRGSLLRQFTDDQTVVAQLVRDGQLTAEDAAQHPHRHVLLSAVGTQPDIEPFLSPGSLQLQPGDTFLLCSDGLTDGVSDATIARLLPEGDPFEVCNKLIAAALEAGGTTMSPSASSGCSPAVTMPPT